MGNASLWIKSPLALYTGEHSDSQSGGIVVQSGLIKEVLQKDQKPSQPTTLTFDASQHVILPGLINAHHHFFQNLTRAYPGALDKELFNWLRSLYPVWANIDEEMVSLSSELAIAELMLSGCTTVSNHHYLFPTGIANALDLQASAVKKLGVRATLTRGSMSLGEDDGGLPPMSTVQDEQIILDDCERSVKTYHQEEDGAMLQIALAPCSPFSVSQELMRASASLAKEKNLLLHTHLCETQDEEAFCIERFGLRPVDYLEDVGWLHDRTWLAHGIHFNDEEILRLGKAGVGICHCPSSNMMLASGICRNKELEAAGSPVGIGVDGSSSNDSSNLMAELRQAMYIQRLRYGSSQVSHLDALRWGTQGSAQCLGRSDIGEIAVGKQADLALFKLDDIRFSGAHDPLAALLLCGAQQVDYLMIAGKWQVENGALLNIDIEQLQANHREAAKRLARLANN